LSIKTFNLFAMLFTLVKSLVNSLMTEDCMALITKILPSNENTVQFIIYIIEMKRI